MNARVGAISLSTGTGSEAAGSASAETEEAIVEALADDFDDLELFRIRVLRVQEIVPGVRCNCRWDARQCRIERTKPGVAKPSCKRLVQPPINSERRIKKLDARCRVY